MSIKISQSSLSSIQLNDILDQEEFKQLLSQKVDSIDFSQHFFIDLCKDFSQQYQSTSTNNKKNPNSYDSQAAIKQKRLLEQAYERSKRPGKLLANEMFRFQQTKQNGSKSQHINIEQEKDYLSQYLMWKQELSPVNKYSTQSKQFKCHEEQFFQQSFKTKQQQARTNIQNKSKQFDKSELNSQIKNIYQEYLQKITQVTSKNIFSSSESSSIEQNYQQQYYSTLKQPNKQRNLSQTKQQIHQEKIKPNLIQKTLDKETHTKLHKFEDSDINQYCFANMIKHKPDFVNVRKLNKEEILSKEKSKNKKQSIRSDNYQESDEIESQSSARLIIIKNSPAIPYEQLSFGRGQKERYSKLTPKQDPYSNVYNSQDIISSNQLISKQISTKQQTTKPPPVIKLNVEKLLRLPYKQFLLFFDQNHRKIISMTQPEQYKRLQAYQIKCLEHAESIHKLRERFASEEGARLIQKLSIEQKQKLFKVLYSQQSGVF